ncbi:hypothetical protein QNA08_10660 [Chelatococcus sp. SYSU_G07232]|uniref:Uncharacterized protein n=1 Tax=Chelatococcus albus TaxID=3047466 RepID=A0ABT7AH73_9HYPH|nr:hypothetical protein [Chelatococcus sp. SYSU_G07232]MDJ1158693.1 hypothetical protein [Chelatococcus sp. SYSU_G07232]
MTDTAIDANVRQSYDNLRLMLEKWRGELVNWRCRLSPAEVARLRGGLGGWDCRDVTIEVDLVDFRGAGEEVRPRLDAVPTSLNLPAEQVDFVIAAERQSLRRNAAFGRLVAAIGDRLHPDRLAAR